MEAVVRDENSVLTVSTLLNGEYGLDDVCLSLPCIINRKGIKNIVETILDQDERESLKKSAEILQKTYLSINL